MPSEAELVALYGADYNAGAGDVPSLEGDPRANVWLLDHLDRVSPRRFVDYGCGSGALLTEVAATGVEALGFDLDVQGVAAASSASGCVAYTFNSIGSHGSSADVLHLGDVLEHVPNPDDVLRQACSLVRPGGTVLAQGPLEANLSLFNGVIAVAALVRWGRPVDALPYHVHLVTARGQQLLFDRVGLTSEEFVTSDIAWPAPERWTSALVVSPRLLGLFLLRRLSSLVWCIAPDHLAERMSNRFRYQGRLPG